MRQTSYRLRNALLFTALTLLTTISGIAQAGNNHNTVADYKQANADLIEQYESKPAPEGLSGLYEAKYKRADDSGEKGTLSAYFDTNIKALFFTAKLDKTDPARWQDKTEAHLAGYYYFDGAALKLNNAIGDPILTGEGAAIEKLSDDHFIVHYYDSQGLKQQLNYIRPQP